MPGSPDLLAAEAKVKEARARLFSTFGEVQDRLTPANIAQDAIESATQSVASVARKGAEAVRARPWAVAAAASAIGLVMARGWIGDIIGGRRRKHETSATPRGLKQRKTAKIVKGQTK